MNLQMTSRRSLLSKCRISVDSFVVVRYTRRKDVMRYDLFKDNKGGRVELTFGENDIGMAARHVLVVLKHKGKWLLTRHSMRGIEFPGGKAEEGESIEEAAIRETIEETGVTITELGKSLLNMLLR